METKKTPLFHEHVKLGGKMADFAGWRMPLWYPTGQLMEHHATRETCGVFDTCHMGEFEIRGPGSLPFLSWMLTNDVKGIDHGRSRYNFMLNDKGGVVDDCILYCFDLEHWMMVVNAGNIEADFAWLRKHSPSDVRLENISDKTIKIDLQGPNAPKLVSRWVDKDTLIGLKYFRFIHDVKIDGMLVCVSRTGYTGEIGFEFYTDVQNGVDLWNLLLVEGKRYDIRPCGLGARDTLRTEAGLPLHGHELRPDRVGLGHPWEFAIFWEHDFLGKDVLVQQKERGVDYYVLPFVMEGKRKALPGWEVVMSVEPVGTVLSGVVSPTLNKTPIGFVGVNRLLEHGTRLWFRMVGRNDVFVGKVGQIPFVSLTSRRRMRDFL